MAFTVAAAVSGLCFVFGLALLVTDRHTRFVAGDPPLVAPPSHVRVIRKEQRGSICDLRVAA